MCKKFMFLRCTSSCHTLATSVFTSVVTLGNFSFHISCHTWQRQFSHQLSHLASLVFTSLVTPGNFTFLFSKISCYMWQLAVLTSLVTPGKFCMFINQCKSFITFNTHKSTGLTCITSNAQKLTVCLTKYVTHCQPHIHQAQPSGTYNTSVQAVWSH